MREIKTLRSPVEEIQDIPVRSGVGVSIGGRIYTGGIVKDRLLVQLGATSINHLGSHETSGV